MAKYDAPPPKNRRADTEALAATIFARLFLGHRGKTAEALAADALAAARTFYRACDDPAPTAAPAPGALTPKE